MILLQVIDTLPGADEIMKITPWTSAGYGLALLACVVTAVVFYKRWADLTQYTRDRDAKLSEFQKNAIAVITKVELRLQDQQDIVKNLEAIKHKIEELAKK